MVQKGKRHSCRHQLCQIFAERFPPLLFRNLPRHGNSRWSGKMVIWGSRSCSGWLTRLLKSDFSRHAGSSSSSNRAGLCLSRCPHLSKPSSASGLTGVLHCSPRPHNNHPASTILGELQSVIVARSAQKKTVEKGFRSSRPLSLAGAIPGSVHLTQSGVLSTQFLKPGKAAECPADALLLLA